VLYVGLVNLCMYESMEWNGTEWIRLAFGKGGRSAIVLGSFASSGREGESVVRGR